MTDHDRKRMDYAAQRRASLEAIASEPFQAMVEVYAEVVGENGKVQGKEQLWYANAAASTNEVLNPAIGREKAGLTSLRGREAWVVQSWSAGCACRRARTARPRARHVP